MGYKPTVYSLVFDDLDGLEVKTYGTSIGQVKKFMTFTDEGRSVEQTVELFDAFVKALISWNLEDGDGNPVPPTAQGLDEFPDSQLMSAIVNAWMQAVSGVDDELGKDSDSGKPFQEESIPMEPLSASQAS
jgi:hypothetical protein